MEPKRVIFAIKIWRIEFKMYLLDKKGPAYRVGGVPDDVSDSFSNNYKGKLA